MCEIKCSCVVLNEAVTTIFFPQMTTTGGTNLGVTPWDYILPLLANKPCYTYPDLQNQESTCKFPPKDTIKAFLTSKSWSGYSSYETERSILVCWKLQAFSKKGCLVSLNWNIWSVLNAAFHWEGKSLLGIWRSCNCWEGIKKLMIIRRLIE